MTNQQLPDGADDELTQAERIRRLMHRCDMEVAHIAELKDQIKTLRAERDELRREVCVWQGLDTGNGSRATAIIRGWDCFKDQPNG